MVAKLVLASTKDHAHRIYLRDGIFAEVVEGQFFALLLGEQLLLDRLERMAAYNQLRSPIGPNKHKPRLMALPCQV